MPADITQKVGVLRLHGGEDGVAPGEYFHDGGLEALLMLLERSELVEDDQTALGDALQYGRCDAAHVLGVALVIFAADAHDDLRVLYFFRRGGDIVKIDVRYAVVILGHAHGYVSARLSPHVGNELLD